MCSSVDPARATGTRLLPGCGLSSSPSSNCQVRPGKGTGTACPLPASHPTDLSREPGGAQERAASPWHLVCVQSPVVDGCGVVAGTARRWRQLPVALEASPPHGASGSSEGLSQRCSPRMRWRGSEGLGAYPSLSPFLLPSMIPTLYPRPGEGRGSWGLVEEGWEGPTGFSAVFFSLLPWTGGCLSLWRPKGPGSRTVESQSSCKGSQRPRALSLVCGMQTCFLPPCRQGQGFSGQLTGLTAGHAHPLLVVEVLILGAVVAT